MWQQKTFGLLTLWWSYWLTRGKRFCYQTFSKYIYWLCLFISEYGLTSFHFSLPLWSTLTSDWLKIILTQPMHSSGKRKSTFASPYWEKNLVIVWPLEETWSDFFSMLPASPSLSYYGGTFCTTLKPFYQLLLVCLSLCRFERRVVSYISASLPTWRKR